MALFEDLKRRGLWRGYCQHVIRLEPILVAMSKRGMPVDPARYARVKRTLELMLAAANRKMQAAVPDEARAIHPKLGYKKVPRDFADGGPTNHAGEEATWAYRYFAAAEAEPLISQIEEQRAVKLLHWKPSGGPNGGLVRFMAHKGWPCPRDFKTNKVTFVDKELERLARQYPKEPLFQAIREYRSAAGMLDNHMVNWAPGADERVHPTFYYDTATGQLGARRPNSQNAPKHKKGQGNLFRWMIVSAHC